jgi:hypothetical protein
VTGDAYRDWVEARTAEGPPALRAQLLAHALAGERAESAPATLARAAERVLAIVEEHPGDRSVALDLLAADALITLALLAQAERAPESLGRFATELLTAERVG